MPQDLAKVIFAWRLDRRIKDSAELFVLVDEWCESCFRHQFSATDHFQPDTTFIEFFQRDLQFCTKSAVLSAPLASA
jgi:hypothetical protein